ncbi:MAG TPA: Maf family nucleotide pyrophosphatase [Cytophagaceae bacterium]
MFTNRNKKIILASNSPRRSQILRDAGFSFEVKSKNVEEIYPESTSLEDIPVYLAELKADAFRDEMQSDEIILAADTIVIHDQQVLGKPKDPKDAKEMLKKLSGSWHNVVSGVCILSQEKTIIIKDLTKVYFREMSAEEIEYYVNTFKPLDKAGAYGIQEWIGMTGVEKIDGSFYNVMGLPIDKVYRKLIQF